MRDKCVYEFAFYQKENSNLLVKQEPCLEDEDKGIDHKRTEDDEQFWKTQTGREFGFIVETPIPKAKRIT